ncbi:MAG: hypothetical protein IT200_16765 [Thermoleophilia bacterium]|nr:hypothetical protein [Thermoleophilia bacterium]
MSVPHATPCPACTWPTRVVDGAIADHPRHDTGERCEGSGTVPAIVPSTPAGCSLVARLRSDERAAAVRADEDEAHTFARLTAKAERDLLRRLLRLVPEEVARAEREAVESARREDARLDAVLEAV